MRLEVFNALFMHVAEQMGAVLRHTASSVNIKERLDFSCAIFDAAANLVANAPHMPVHLGSMGASVSAVLDDVRRRPASRRCVPRELAVRRRHPPARHDGRFTGLRRGRLARRILYGLACASRRRGRDLARFHAAGQPHHRRRRRADRADADHARWGARRGPAAAAVLRQPLARAEFPAEPRGPAGAAGGEFPWRARTAARRGRPWTRHAARVHGSRAGQRRTLRAPRDPPAARRQLPLRDGQRPGDRRAHRRRRRRPARPPSISRAPRRSRPTTSTRRAPSRPRRCSTSSAR